MSLVCCLSIKCSFLRNLACSVPFFHHIARFYTITTLQKHNYRTAVISLPRCGYIVTAQREQRYRGVIARYLFLSRFLNTRTHTPNLRSINHNQGCTNAYRFQKNIPSILLHQHFNQLGREAFYLKLDIFAHN